MEAPQIPVADQEGPDSPNQNGTTSSKHQVRDDLTSCNNDQPKEEQNGAHRDRIPARGCLLRSPVAPGLSVTEISDQGQGDPSISPPLSETRNIGHEDDINESDDGERQGPTIQQRPVEEGSFDTVQLASEVRKLAERQDSLLALLARSLKVPSASPVPETSQRGDLTPQEVDWTINVAQRYWESLLPTDEHISSTVGIFLGNMAGGEQWLKKASGARSSVNPKVEVTCESVTGDTTVKASYIFEWKPCAIDLESEYWLCPPPTDTDADTEAVVAEVRQHWPTALSEECHGWLGVDVGGSMSAVPPMMPQVSMLASPMP